MPTSANEPGRLRVATAPHAGEPHARGHGAGDHVKEHFWNWPNTITVLRIGVVPIFLLMPIPALHTKTGSAVVAWLFIVAATSDLLDGWLARRGQQVTKIGKLLDPLADKLLVATALIMLLAIGRIEWWGAWMVVVIVGRELAVTGLRGIASSQGTIMAATLPGKLKAVFQNIAIGALLFHYRTLGLPAHDVGLLFLAAATVLTLWSGYLYFADYFGWRSRPLPALETEER
jgi:CDP-diacylglycerol---glycerol-3-phosphate 3-phosphatidyltransferase